MEEKTMKALTAPFPESQVKTRPGSFGKKNVRYLPASVIISRLSDVAQGQWDFRIVSHQVLENGEVLVHGRLEVLGVVKEAFGRCASVSRDGEVIRSLGDCYKSASTQALVVAARLTGVAAYLYSDDPIDLPEEKPTRIKPTEPARNEPPSPANRASSKQVSAIWSIGRKLGLNANEIRARCMAEFGAFPEQPLRVAYLPGFFSIPGVPEDAPSHVVHLLGNGVMCLYAPGEWRPELTCREVLQQRAYPHAIKLLNFAAGRRRAFAIVS